MMNDTGISVSSQIVHGIPLLTLAPMVSRACPVVFFIPGFSSRKESGLGLGHGLAQAGFFVAAFDPWLHGERYDPRLERAAAPENGGLYPPETGLDTGVLFYRIVGKCLADVQTLLAHLADDPRADVTRCGVTGFSMGACASFAVFAGLAQIEAAVPMMGVPGFGRRWQDLLDECAFSNPAWAAALAARAQDVRVHTALVRAIDPYEMLKQAAPRALMLMSGDFDTDQPKHYMVDCYRDLLPAYTASPERLKLNIYPTPHRVTSDMEHDAVDWFCRHLRGGPAERAGVYNPQSTF
jgi:dienelactone hydrolase